MNDAAVSLVRAAARGDQNAYSDLIKEYTGFVFTIAFRMTNDYHMAEDLSQEIFVKSWMKLDRLANPAAFPGWLATIARNTCLSSIGKRNRKHEVGEEEAGLDHLNPVMPPSYNPSRVILEAAIARLSMQDRELITLSYFQELSSAEVAAIMNIPAGTVRVYLMRARQKLKDILKGKEDELFSE